MNNEIIVMKINEYIKELQTIYNEIDNCIEYLQTVWQDDAMQAYLNKYSKLGIDYKKSIDELNKIKQIIKSNKKEENSNE